MVKQTFTYELVPTKTFCRAQRKRKTHVFTTQAGNYNEALAVAQEKAAELSTKKGTEYGVARIY